MRRSMHHVHNANGPRAHRTGVPSDMVGARAFEPNGHSGDPNDDRVRTPSLRAGADSVSPARGINTVGGAAKGRFYLGVLVVFVLVGLALLGVFRPDAAYLGRIIGQTGVAAFQGALVILAGIFAARLVRLLYRFGRRAMAVGAGVFLGLFLSLLAVQIVAGVASDAKINATIERMPTRNVDEFYAWRRGVRVQVFPPRDRRVNFEEIEHSYLRPAIRDIEDERLDTRMTGPIDNKANARAAIQTFIFGHKQGASTLLEQADKLSEGKFKSAWLDKPVQKVHALRLNQRFPDPTEQIALYVNIAPIDEVHNVGYAAAHFFGKGIPQLNPAESALLAALFNNPPKFNPLLHPKEALARRNVVLDQMAKSGSITSDEDDSFKKQPLGLIQRVTVRALIQYADAAARTEL